MRGVLQSLNENAGAIQAIATAALLLITGWYARLTYRLVKVQEAVHRERTAELRSVVLTIRQGLLQLPSDTATAAAKMRDAAIWDDDDLPTLRALASWFSSDAGDHAARALAPLRWLGTQAREAKRAGFNWEGFPWSKYREELAIAQYHVVAIWGAVTAGRVT